MYTDAEIAALVSERKELTRNFDDMIRLSGLLPVSKTPSEVYA